MKRTTKRYVVTNSNLNSYGYRVLTSGVDLTQFLKNPIVFWIHKKGDYKLPLGRAVDVRIEGDNITCAIDFTEADPFPLKIYNMMEDGTIGMMSLGAIPVELSTDAVDMLPGQTGPTVTKCKATEFSVADIGANDDALSVELFDNSGNIIQLSNGSIPADILLALAKKKVVSSIEHKPSTLKVVNNAVAAGKLTTDTANTLLSMGNDDKTVSKTLEAIKNMPVNPDRLDGSMPKSVLPLVTKSYSELENGWGNGLKTLKDHAPEVYKAKFFEKHGRLPAEKDGKPL